MNKNKIYVKVKIFYNDLINNLMCIINYFNYKYKVVLINWYFGYVFIRFVFDILCKEIKGWWLSYLLYIML